MLQHHRIKYACPCCDQSLKVAPTPARIIPRGLLTEEAQAWVITGKYQFGMPLYRTAALLRRFGGDMGVLPLEFKPGTNRLTLALDGTETYDVTGERKPRADLTLVIHRRNGERLAVPMTCRLDTAEELSIYEAGGVLQRFAQDFLASTTAVA